MSIGPRFRPVDEQGLNVALYRIDAALAEMAKSTPQPDIALELRLAKCALRGACGDPLYSREFHDLLGLIFSQLGHPDDAHSTTCAHVIAEAIRTFVKKYVNTTVPGLHTGD